MSSHRLTGISRQKCRSPGLLTGRQMALCIVRALIFLIRNNNAPGILIGLALLCIAAEIRIRQQLLQHRQAAVSAVVCRKCRCGGFVVFPCLVRIGSCLPDGFSASAVQEIRTGKHVGRGGIGFLGFSSVLALAVIFLLHMLHGNGDFLRFLKGHRSLVQLIFQKPGSGLHGLVFLPILPEARNASGRGRGSGQHHRAADRAKQKEQECQQKRGTLLSSPFLLYSVSDFRISAHDFPFTTSPAQDSAIVSRSERSRLEKSPPASPPPPVLLPPFCFSPSVVSAS